MKPKRVTQDEASRAEAVLKAYADQRRDDARIAREHRDERIARTVDWLLQNSIPDPRGWAAREHEEQKLRGNGKGMTPEEAETYYLGSLEYSLRVVLSALPADDYAAMAAEIRNLRNV